MVRKYAKMLLPALAAALVFFISSACRADVADRVIIVVNDEVITQREYDKALIPVKQGLESNFEGEELEARLKAAEEGIKDHLINAKLAISLAKKENIQIDEEELASRIETIRSYYGTEQEFLVALRERGTTLSEFEKEIRDQMLAQQLVQEKVSSNIVVTPGEIRDLYEKNKDQMEAPLQVKVRTIMLRRTGERGDEASKREMEEILSEARTTKDFASLAEKTSEGPYADEGGDMGYIIPGQTVDEIDSVIFSLEQGDISEVVETPIGYHIFYAEEIRQPRTLEFAEVNDFLREQLFMHKFQEELVKYLKENREKAYISYKDKSKS
jgi:peptidyl-prolyl cis-trans isomerase SurA